MSSFLFSGAFVETELIVPYDGIGVWATLQPEQGTISGTVNNLSIYVSAKTSVYPQTHRIYVILWCGGEPYISEEFDCAFDSQNYNGGIFEFQLSAPTESGIDINGLTNVQIMLASGGPITIYGDVIVDVDYTSATAGCYIGVSSIARKLVNVYLGVNDLARKVTKGYIGGSNGVARLFYTALVPFTYSYTGAYTESEATIDGVAYTVLTITSSGTLTVSRAINVDAWLCGGGANGKTYRASSPAFYAGGGGGGGYANSGTLAIEASLAITVPSAGGIANCGGIIANPGSSDASGSANRGTDGGSGGGEGGSNSSSGGIGKGAGTSTIPTQFGLTQAHCAGGAGGTYSDRYGGNGGSNGSDGYEKTRISSNGRKGGAVGGGNGNSSATFYGGGGGGANYASNGTAFAGSGYQGVVYIRWKKEDAA